MPAKITVLYPKTNDSKFDLDYYLKTHMPLVSKHWESQGLKGWEVIKVESGMQGATPEYSIVATLIYDEVSHFEKCVSHESAKDVFGDVPNFSNKGPVLLIGEVVGHKTH